MLRYFVILLIMVIRWPTPVPFTSKDRVAYQINGKTTMSKEYKMHKKDIWVGRLLLVTCSIFKQLSLLFSKQTHTFQKHLTNVENISKRQISLYTFLRTRIITKIAYTNDLFYKMLLKPHQTHFQTTKASGLSK